MDKFNYNRAKDTAERLIKRFGQQSTFIRQTGESYDPTSGTVQTTEEEYTYDAVWVDFSKDEVNDSSILKGDVRILVAGTVKVDDRVARNGEEFRIVDAETINPGGVQVMMEAQGRR